MVSRGLVLGLLLLAASAPAAGQQAAAATVSPIRFGILPIGSASESLEQW
jgi:phosphonate transport system substrate-binding protein